MDIYKTILNLAAASETPHAAWVILQRYVKLTGVLAHEQKEKRFLESRIDMLSGTLDYEKDNAMQLPNDPTDPLRVAWANHIGVQPNDDRVYGWQVEFDYFAAGWCAGYCDGVQYAATEYRELREARTGGGQRG